MISNLKDKLSMLSYGNVNTKQGNTVDRAAQREKTALELGAACIKNEYGSFILKRNRLNLSENPLFIPSEDVWRKLGCKDISKVMFFDTETSGLSSGCFAFLVGIAYIDNGYAVTEQLFLDDLDDEEAMLYYLWDNYKEYTVVTYNGRSFDIPLINNRLILNSVTRERFGLDNIDLLRYTRIIWSGVFNDCSLSNIEGKVLGFHRKNDIPGSEIPLAYQDFLKNKNVSAIKRILNHNFSDVLNMIQIMNVVGEIMFSDNGKRTFIEAYSIGRYFFNRKSYVTSKGYFNEAYSLSCLNKGDKSDIIREMALKYLVLLHKKENEDQSVRKLCLEIIKRKECDPFACVEIAKIYEHKDKNYILALKYSSDALKSTFFTKKTGYTYKDILHRIKRLQSKLKVEDK
ncbi:MAG: hypothetical protein E7315_06410 [Clostridiales bacterium]|nr:hypothetical protein [Clostridiales bacterium]